MSRVHGGKLVVLFYVPNTDYKLCAIKESVQQEVLENFITGPSTDGQKVGDWYRVDNEDDAKKNHQSCPAVRCIQLDPCAQVVEGYLTIIFPCGYGVVVNLLANVFYTCTCIAAMSSYVHNSLFGRIFVENMRLSSLLATLLSAPASVLLVWHCE